jgi:hypothetical protein
MICSRVILHFKPQESYAKYIRLVAGAMILLQVSEVAVRLFGGKGMADLEERIEQMAKEFSPALEWEMPDAQEVQNKWEQMLMDAAKRQVPEEKRQVPEASTESAEESLPVIRVEIEEIRVEKEVPCKN